MDQDRVRPIQADRAEGLGALERLALDPEEHDREGHELAAGTDLGVGRELREASLAEQPRRHVGVRAALAPRAEQHAALLEHREERFAGDARRVAVANGQVSLPPPDLFGTRDLLEHQPASSPCRGLKYAISRI